MPNMWQYETVVLENSPEEAKETLNRYGKLGYQILHVKESAEGKLFTILGRDTGRPIDEGEDKVGHDWLVDAVSPSSGFGDG